MNYFTGIRYSPVTEIFYTFHKSYLYRFPTYKNIHNDCKKWALSDYHDMNHRSHHWLMATEKQCIEHNLETLIRRIS